MRQLSGYVVIVVASMVWPTAPQAFAAEMPGAVTLSAVTCADYATTEAEASTLAVACDHEVEVLGRRTEWNTVMALPDGSMRLDVAVNAIRTRVSGQWDEIDTTVERTPDGLAVVSPAMPMTFSDGTEGTPLSTITRDGHTISMDAPLPLTEPVIDGDQIVYPEVLPDVDLVVNVHPDGTGFSEVLRVDSPEAAKHPDLAKLTFPIQTSEGITIKPAGKGFVAVDGAGEQVFTSPAPIMWDSASEVSASPVSSARGAAPMVSQDAGEDPSAAPRTGDSVTAMDIEVTEESVIIIPDAGLLTDEDTTWPVFIDPGLSGNLHERALIRSAMPNTVVGYNFGGTEGVGNCRSSEDVNCRYANDVFRLVYEFTIPELGALVGSDVIAASFSAFGTHSWSCAATGIEVHSVGGAILFSGTPSCQ